MTRSSTPADHSSPSGPDYRRLMVLIFAIGLMAVWALMRWHYGEGGSGKLAAAAAGRVGLFLLALWLAWPSLRRPARWLPPGFAMICVLALAVLAARPRMIIVVVPAVGLLLALSSMVRLFRP